MLTKKVSYYLMSLILSACLILFDSTISQAKRPAYQGNTVTGKITSSEDNSALPGVNIVEKGTTNGTISDLDGKYSLNVSENATLIISYVGYVGMETSLNGRSVIDFSMEPDVTSLSEVVVIGYGTIAKKDFTGAVSQLDAEKLETESTSNMTDMLRGSMPGLNVGMTTNPKGISSSSDMLVRGQTSIRADADDQKSANAPLIVVDGMIYYGDLADINPSDIATFDVLKDASSAAIYGARASNGVVLITTKKGKKGKPIINVSTSVGMARLSGQEITPMNPDAFIDWRIAGFESNERHQIGIGPGYYNSSNDLPAGVSVDDWKAYDGSSSATDLDAIWLNRIGFSPIEITNYEEGNTVKWNDYQYQNALTQDYNVSISGSSDKINYYWSLGYTDNEGIRYNQSYNAIRSRINLEASVTDWLKVGTNTSFTIRDESPILASDNMVQNTPYASFYEEDGKTIVYAPTGNISNSRHPWLDLTYRDRFLKYNSLMSKIYATITLPLGFTFTSEYITRFNWNRDYNSYSSAHFDWGKQGGRASRKNNTLFEWQVNNILKWNKVFDDHSFDVTLVQNAEKYQTWEDYTERQQFQPNDLLGYHRLQAATEDVSITSNDEVSTGDALLARLNYSYKSRYALTTSFRRDGYSAFGQKNPRANFGSVALGWTISEEDFYNIEWLDLLKLRGSFGTNGNRGVGRYDALSNLATGKFVLINGGSPSYVSQLYTSRMANENLQWERTSAYNFGLDFSLLEGRITGDVEVYFMTTDDLLIPRQLPKLTGFSSVFSNLGQVKNNGIEFAINTINIDKVDFRWSSAFSFAHNKNEITHLYGDMVLDENGNEVEADDVTNKWFIGHALDEIWDYKIDGIWQEDEKDEAGNYSRSPGDFKLIDVDGDGVYTDADKQFQGNTAPKVRLTFRNDFSYKNFDLSIKMYSYLGYFSANNHKKNNDVFYDRGTSLDAPYWTPENPSNEWARVESYESGFTVWENNSFVRIDNIALTYNVPSSFLDKYNVVGLRLSVVAQNPLVWAPEWTWMDPEIKGYTPSTYSFKLNLTL